MGLHVSHECWQGPYSSFNNFRRKLCQAAGWGSLDAYYAGEQKFPDPKEDALVYLLDHSDCEGHLDVEVLLPLAERLEGLMEALDGLEPPDMPEFLRGSILAHTFAVGCRKAAFLEERVEFH